MQIRPIDKKLQYQIQKLTSTTAATLEKPGSVQEADETQKKEDLLKYRPNPELLVSKTNATEDVSQSYTTRFIVKLMYKSMTCMSESIIFLLHFHDQLILLSQDDSGVYRPPKFAPTSMEEGKMSRQEKNALRKEKETMRQANESAYVRDLMNEMEGRPEEVVGSFMFVPTIFFLRSMDLWLIMAKYRLGKR